MPDTPPEHPATATQPDTLLDKLLDGLIRAVRERKNPDGLIKRGLRAFQKLLLVLSVAYAVCLVLVLALMEWVGERNYILAFLLYLPPLGWLLPLAVLTPVCLVFRWQIVSIHMGCVIVVMLFYMHPRWSGAKQPSGTGITVLTNNRGEANYTSPTEYIGRTKPDIVALQEAGNAPAYQAAFPQLHVKGVDQFTLMSRFEITKAEVLPLTLRNLPVGARFELDCDGRKLVVYNIHPVSPRIDLDQMRGLGFPVLVLAPSSTRWGPEREKLKERWAERMEVLRKLSELMEQEKEPFLAVGDFNFPDHGVGYRLYASKLTDAFAARGSGYGFTMPGRTRNPLSFFGPWLRIDYIWSSKALKPVWCEREPARASQHRAVVATFEWAE